MQEIPGAIRQTGWELRNREGVRLRAYADVVADGGNSGGRDGVMSSLLMDILKTSASNDRDSSADGRQGDSVTGLIREALEVFVGSGDSPRWARPGACDEGGEAVMCPLIVTPSFVTNTIQHIS